MNSISKTIKNLRWKSNTQVEILSRKFTQKCDVTEQRMAVKFVLAPKVNFEMSDLQFWHTYGVFDMKDT